MILKLNLNTTLTLICTTYIKALCNQYKCIHHCSLKALKGHYAKNPSAFFIFEPISRNLSHKSTS